ncbi:MAG: UPF0175 family protein [Patescibacteria group bacterium]|nr:UPF0175 family protein [Patescibacteria group bacterium]
MSELTLDIPDEQVLALNVPREKLADELRMLAAVKLYEMDRLSSGAAAEFAGVPKPVFLERLGDYRVATFRQSEGELQEELRNA